MKTITGVTILFVVALVLAGGVWLFSKNVEPPAQTSEENTLLETLDTSNDCSGDWDACCESACSDFCKEHDTDVLNKYTNNHLCSCWCT